MNEAMRINSPFGLPQRTLDDMACALRAFPEIQKTAIFGSRATGNYKPNSDIDICLWGDIDVKLLAKITGALNTLSTPYKFDVVVYDQITHPPFKQHINSYGKDFFAALKKGDD